MSTGARGNDDAPQPYPDAPTTFVSQVYGRGGRPVGPEPVRTPSGPRPPSGPAGPVRPAPPRRQRPTWKRVLLWVAVLVALWLVFLVAVGALAYGRIERVAFAPEGERPADGPGTTYLMVGSDSREGLSEEQSAEFGTGVAEGKRTDTILLLHVGDGPASLVSIPRDSYVEIPGRGRNKINAAYAFGGPQLLTQTIELNTGVRVDEYVEVGFGGFAGIVEAVGGVDICLDEPIQDPMANLDLGAGCQTLDGTQSLSYVRTRAGGRGDLDRVVRQQQFLSLLAKEMVSPWTVLNPVRYARTAFSASDALTVGDSTGPVDLVRFALGMRSATGPDGQMRTVPVAGTDNVSGAGSVVLWDDEAAAALFAAIQQDQPLPAAG